MLFISRSTFHVAQTKKKKQIVIFFLQNVFPFLFVKLLQNNLALRASRIIIYNIVILSENICYTHKNVVIVYFFS